MNFHKVNKLGTKLYPELPYGMHSSKFRIQGQIDKDGKAFGICRFIKDDKSIYEGQIFNNQMHGYGRLIYKNGDIYEGMFLRNKKQGHGRMRKIRCGEKIDQDGKWESDVF